MRHCWSGSSPSCARAPVLNALASGWSAALLAGLALYAGVTFLVGAQFSLEAMAQTTGAPWHNPGTRSPAPDP
ncbi:hypothetical protein LP419_22295 [Massilia sp. H-1]|nr:hypothetical protein LP419_22295 [Massilia sp. H-1]